LRAILMTSNCSLHQSFHAREERKHACMSWTPATRG
jgi:hypothetical protein